MSGMGFPGPGCGPTNHNPMNQAPNFVSHMMKPIGMDMTPPQLNPCATGTCCGSSCTFDCLCHLIDSDAKGIDVDDIYQVLGRDVLKSSVLDDIDLYLECDDDNVYTKAMPSKPGMESTKPKNSQEPFKFKFSFPTNTTPPVSDSKKSFVCEFCSQSFIKDHLLKNHQAKSHNVKDLFPCPQCAYRGQQHAHLQKHIKRMHKKSSQSDDSSNNLSQNVAVVPPKSAIEPADMSEQSSLASNMPDTLQQCNPTTDIKKPSEDWPPLSNNNKPIAARIQGTANLPQSNINQGNVNVVQFGKADAFPQLPQQPESQEQKVPVAYNRRQSTSSRSFGTEPSPDPRSVPECSPRPGSRQSGHESSNDFSILDISNNTFKVAETATFLPGESLLAQLEGPDIYGSPKVDQVPFAVPSPHSLLVHTPTSASPGVPMALGQVHDRPPVLNRAQTFPPGRAILPGNVSVINQAIAVASSCPPRIAPTPPEILEQKRRKMSPGPYASGRNSALSVGANSQGFASPSPTSCVPQIVPTTPDFSRPPMSPMSQASSQHSSPTFGHVNQRFLSPSPTVSQPRALPTPPEIIRHRVSPTQRGHHYQASSAINVGGLNAGFPVQSPPVGFPRMMQGPSPTGVPGKQMNYHDYQQLHLPHPSTVPRNANPQLDPHQPRMTPANPARFPPATYQPSIQAHHVISEQQQYSPNIHPGQFNPGQQFYPPNGLGFQGQYNELPRYPHGGPRYPPRMPLGVQGQHVSNTQRSGPGPSPPYLSPTGPQSPRMNPNQRFITAGPEAGFPPQVQSQMYSSRQQQPMQRFTYPVQRHPYRVPYDGGGQLQGMGQPQGNSIMQTVPRTNLPQGVTGFPMQQTRPSMIIRVQNPNQSNQAMMAQGRNVGYISGQEQIYRQPHQTSSMEFRSPIHSSPEGNVPSGQVMSASGMTSPQVSQGSAANVASHSNISLLLNSGLPHSHGNTVLAQQLTNIGDNSSGGNKHVLCQNALSERSRRTKSNHIEADVREVKSVNQENASPLSNPSFDPSVKHRASRHTEFHTKTVDEQNKVTADAMDVNEDNNMAPEITDKTIVSVLGGKEKSNANENNVSIDKRSADDRVNDKINWLLLQCGVNKKSDSKSGNSEVCRLEIKTSEEEIGPVVHIMETQEVEGEMENILDDISRSESDATQSDSVLPVMSPQMNDEVFSPPSNNLDNSPPKLSRIDFPSNDTSDFKCEKCDYVCASKQLLKSHERHKHDPNRNVYKCETCQVELKQKASYESHMAKHNGEFKYECHVCHKLFVNRLSFNLHLKTHSTERPFKCGMDMCNKAFRTKSDLNEHEKVVHGERIHKCSYAGCEKSYTLEKDLKAHQVGHTIALKCSWPRCRKTFRDRFNLNNHYKTHTKEKPIECLHCDFRCIQRTSLESHMKNHHLGSA
ncbi:uncharacterized protein LOC135484221 [Lineus longissimus]|uniref:uncharacterized protein LOC135484221 n=1 Tax=Lineus longissimus TaxID=88925 RepID=UPI002B4CCEA8